MRYYLFRPDANHYAAVGVSVEESDRVVDVHFSDQPAISAWVPVQVFGFEDNPSAVGDFPSLSNFFRVPVVSRRAWDILQPFLGHCCEALPIIDPTGNAKFIVHVLDTVDCLDLENSEVERFEDGGVMWVERYSLKTHMVLGKHMFKLPRRSGGELLVDEEFRRIVEANGLKGLKFKELPI